MKTVTKLVCIAGLVGLAATATAQVFTFGVDADKQSIPDGDLNGSTFKGTVNGITSALSTNSFKVSLDLVGDPIAANGDFYAYIRSPSGQVAVLLNRVGVPSNGGVGYADNGMNVRFYDGNDEANHAFTDVHWYQLDPVYVGIPGDNGLTGIFRPDGRSIDPLSLPGAFSTANRDKTFSAFQGINPNGDWGLFIADVSSGGSARLTSWGLDFTPIPEPQEYAMAISAGLMAFALYRRRIIKSA